MQTNSIWDREFKKGRSKICGRQSLKNLKGYGLPKADHAPFKFFKGCLPQILLGPFLNTWTQLILLILSIPTKNIRNSGFLMFSGGMERAWLLEMV